MLLQERMIAAVRAQCEGDSGMMAALMYGSFATGEGDAHSDIEFWLFFTEAELPEPRAWVERIAPVAACFQNEFGTRVAVFENGVRGEFHFEPVSRLSHIREWAKQYEAGGVEVVLDRTGELRDHVAFLEAHVPDRRAPQRVQALCNRFANWYRLGRAVLGRGEYARALDVLSTLHRYLLWMARMVEGQEHHHWGTPSRALEADLSSAAYARFRACTAPLDPVALHGAYAEIRRWAAELMDDLTETLGIESRTDLMDLP